jgi:predicted TIM-barrel fold metal-dependent hydrolase
MIIDSHVHLKHGGIVATEYTPEEIILIMDAAGVDKSVVFAISTTTKRSIEFAREAQLKYPNRLIPYAYVFPSIKENILEQLENSVTQFGFKGFKIHHGQCRYNETLSNPVFELAGSLQVPCLIDFVGHVNNLEEVARNFPKTKFIGAHLGQYLCVQPKLLEDFIVLGKKYKNIYFDISGVVLLGIIPEAIQQLGSERIFWGRMGLAASLQ